MTVLKRMLVFCVLACLVMAWMPVSASAVDPVSAATMANALAQAITAYGASQGVSMTYDVADTDGIGKGVNDLWEDFKTDIQDQNVPTYDSFAVTVWSTLFSKVGDKVAVNLDAQSVSYLDKFWNWLLTGPAEMQKVDDQYYEWSIDSNTGLVNPISINSTSFITINGKTLFDLPYVLDYVGQNKQIVMSSSYSNAYYVPIKFSNDANYGRVWALIYADSRPSVKRAYTDNTWSGTEYCVQWTGNWWYYNFGDQVKNNVAYYSTGLTTSNTGIQVLEDLFGNPPASISGISDTDTISIQPYIGDSVPQNVYIPDNDDVNYEPIPAQIPIDINWDDTLFGNGSGTLTDAQSEAVTGAIDNAITENPAKTLELADTANPPVPGEVYIPFLPVTLPSFNFNFSGIWHYVVSWIGSLGAWFSMVLTVWANLPYAMTVPVYACLVILIVLGVYRRFLS